jgi:hypothetical protein
MTRLSDRHGLAGLQLRWDLCDEKNQLEDGAPALVALRAEASC